MIDWNIEQVIAIVRLIRYFVRRSSTTLDGRRQVAHRRAGLSVSAAVAAARIRLSS